jgi:hypothetical protein
MRMQGKKNPKKAMTKSPDYYIATVKPFSISARNFARKDYLQYLRENNVNPPPIPRKLDGDKEARLITIACSHPPEGYAHWTLDLLADKMVKLKIVDAISGKTIGRVLKKRVKTSPTAMLGYSTSTKR